MSQVLLDGKWVDGKEIDPGKHSLLGVFRSPSPPFGNIFCPCGQTLWFVHENFEHWKNGHFDTPQYSTIKENE